MNKLDLDKDKKENAIILSFQIFKINFVASEVTGDWLYKLSFI